MEIKCPYNLNQFLLGEPIFENTFPKEECEQRKFYGDCYHCFSTAIARRDSQLKNKDNVLEKIRTELIQSIQNGTLKIESGNEELFRIIDKYRTKSKE